MPLVWYLVTPYDFNHPTFLFFSFFFAILVLIVPSLFLSSRAGSTTANLSPPRSKGRYLALVLIKMDTDKPRKDAQNGR